MSASALSARPVPRKLEAAPARPLAVPAPPAGNGNLPKKADGSPDFSKMTPAQKVAYSVQRNRESLARNGNGAA